MTRTAALAALLILAPALTAHESLRPPLRDLAQAVVQLAKQQKQEVIAFGEFTCPATLSANAGPAIQRLLGQELEKLGVRVQEKAALEVKGDYAKVKNPRSEFDEVKLTLTVLDTATRDAVGVLPGKFVAGTEAMMALLGGTGSMSGGGTEKERNRQASEAIDRPAGWAGGFESRSRADSPFGVTILARPKGQPVGFVARPASLSGPHAFAPLAVGEEFQVQISNRSTQEMAATITLDGLSIFTFAEVRNPKTGMPFQHYILKGGQTVAASGWLRTLESSFAFEVGRYGEGEASRLLGSRAKIGTITVTFAPTREVAKPGSAPTLGSAGPGEVKRGAEFADIKNVVVRDAGPIIDVVTVRYQR